MRRSVLLRIPLLIIVSACANAEMPAKKEFVNSIGMKFVRIEPGTFHMGQSERLQPELLPLIRGGERGGRFDFLADGDYDEKPVHKVKIARPFYMAVHEVTNKHYELFDPEHRRLRGKQGLSTDDDEAAIFVSWYDAQAYCRWLSNMEGLKYRLPTEAEWEYACRARTTSHFHTGDFLPAEFHKKPMGANKPRTPLFVGQTPPNAWGLFDMHGNVEEWCHDWYGPYHPGPVVDPVGYADGDFRVTRGGSHGTKDYYLRSANRMGAFPNDRQWLIGFRLVIGELPHTQPLTRPLPPLNQRNVVQRDRAELMQGPDPSRPYFKGPRRFVNIPRDASGPLFPSHNHSPAITECPNGDLLASWFTCVTETQREMAKAASRLRWGQEQWEPASVFLDQPDRNDTVQALWNDGDKTIYHFTDASVGAGYGTVAVALRKSTDSGATWSKARIILPEHVPPRQIWGGHQLGPWVFRMNDGAIAIVTDGFPTLWISHDEGLTWNSCEGDIVGNHPGVAQLADGRLVGLVRQQEVEAKQIITTYQDMGRTLTHVARKWRMAQGYSEDLGKTWSREASIFPGIEGGQRVALLRLKEGPLFFASFADDQARGPGIIITDSSGSRREVRGLFAAVSDDGGKTWANVRLVSDDGPGRAVETTNGGLFAMSARNAEPRGYLAACQGANGLIHLITSRNHYTFNLAWLRTPPPPLKYPPMKVKQVVETFKGPKKFDAEGWTPYKGYLGGFNGKGQLTILSRSHYKGLNRLLGAGSFEMTLSLLNIRYSPRADTASPGITIWLRDAQAHRLVFEVREDRLRFAMVDQEKRPRIPEGPEYQVTYSTPPTSAKMKFSYDETSKRIRIYYGLDGADATTELPQSRFGIYFGTPLSECTAAHIMMSNGSVDLDHFQVRPLNE